MWGLIYGRLCHGYKGTRKGQEYLDIKYLLDVVEYLMGWGK